MFSSRFFLKILSNPFSTLVARARTKRDNAVKRHKHTHTLNTLEKETGRAAHVNVKFTHKPKESLHTSSRGTKIQRRRRLERAILVRGMPRRKRGEKKNNATGKHGGGKSRSKHTIPDKNIEGGGGGRDD